MATDRPAGIFISSRWDDAGPMADALYDRLAQHFGRERVVIGNEIMSMAGGLALKVVLGTKRVVLAVIGPRWRTGDRQRSLLDDPDDRIRVELETASQLGLRVVPVLIAGATMPARAELPASLEWLVDRHALVIRGERVAQDVGFIIQWLETMLGGIQAFRPQSPPAARRAPKGDRPRPAARAAPQASPAAGKADPIRDLKVFLCHSSSDKPQVRTLYAQLKAEGAQPWLDEEDLLPGQDWDLEIRKAIRACHVVLVCLSRASISKVGYIQKEIKHVLDVADEQPDGTIFLIPVKLERCDLPDRIRRWQWVNLFEDVGYGKLLRALRSRAALIGAP